MLNRLSRRILAGLVSGLLLAAQQGALAHLVSHAADGKSPAQEKTQIHHKLCGKCLFSEKLCHALDAQKRLPCIDNLSHARVSVLADTGASLDPQRRGCRGPPTYL